MFQVSRVLLDRGLLRHLEDLDSVGLGHRVDQHLRELGQGHERSLALDVDSHGADGCGWLSCLGRRLGRAAFVGGVEPLVGESQEEVGDVAEGGTEHDDLGVD